MLKKIKTGRIMFVAIFLLLVPMLVSAAGNKETGNDNGKTLDQEVLTLLDQVESGDLTLDEAKNQFQTLEKEYQIKAEEKKMVMKMMDEVGSGIKKSEEFKEQLKEQLQTRTRTQDRVQLQDKTTKANQPKSGTASGNGSGTGKK